MERTVRPSARPQSLWKSEAWLPPSSQSQSGWLRLEVGTIFSLDEYPLLQAPATGSPAITLWVSALLTELFWMGEPLLLAAGSHFKKLGFHPSQCSEMRQGGRRGSGWSVRVSASPPFPFLEPKIS